MREPGPPVPPNGQQPSAICRTSHLRFSHCAAKQGMENMPRLANTSLLLGPTETARTYLFADPVLITAWQRMGVQPPDL